MTVYDLVRCLNLVFTLYNLISTLLVSFTVIKNNLNKLSNLIKCIRCASNSYDRQIREEDR